MNSQQQDWAKNPRLQNIDPERLELLRSLASQGSGKSPTELLPFLMATASGDGSHGLHFSNAETEAIIEVLKEGKSPAYQRKLDKMIRMLSFIK